MKRSKDGGMPFVAIGVVLLILASAFGVMITQSKDVERTAEDIVTELGSLDSAIAYTQTSVQRGLGELIFSISTDPDGGPLEQRAETFDKRSAEWMKNAFPSMDKGVSVSVQEYEFVLEAESLKMASSDLFTDGYLPTFLKATGHYTATFISGSGTVQRVTQISTDGTCALPLVAEQGSLFEQMTSGEGTALSQMMTQQLTALAQFRVLNGYGALSEYGNMGTMSIITADDVKAAYKSSMNVLEMLVFRTASGGLDHGMKQIDLADWLISENGKIEIDLSAVYSQALISIIDDLILKWFDYLYGNVALNMADSAYDLVRNAWDALIGFLKGTNEFSAAPYIEKVMKDNGLDINKYRYLNSGKTASIKISSVNVTVGGKNMTIPSLSLSPKYPSVDLMSYEGISKFKKHYREDSNEIRDWIRNVINAAAVKVGTSKALGTVSFSVDPHDDESFMRTVGKAVDAALNGSEAKIDVIMRSAISEQRMTDPFYSEIYSVIANNSEEIYGMDVFKKNIVASIEYSLVSYFDSLDIELTVDELKNMTSIVYNRQETVQAIGQYKEAVNGCLIGLSPLSEIPSGKSGAMKEICTGIFQGGLLIADFATNVPERIRMLCSESIEITDINPYSRTVELPGTDSFKLLGIGNKTSIEKISFSYDSMPNVRIKGPNDNLSKCVHYVGFKDKSGASFSTAFSVVVEDNLTYTLKSSGKLESAMGISDSVYRGSSSIKMELLIVVASGWGLAGVKDYKASNALISDVWNALISILVPLIEPLFQALTMVYDTLNIMNSAAGVGINFVAKVMKFIYETQMRALDLIVSFVEEKLERLFDSTLRDLIDKVQWIVGIDMSKQTVGFEYMGWTITFTTKLTTLASNTKTLVTIAVSGKLYGLDVKCSLTVKERGSGANKQLLLTGDAEVRGNDWHVYFYIDPLMKSTPCLLSMSGHYKTIKFDVLIPETVQYQRVTFALSDIPALGEILSNIPLPFPGLKAEVDAGIELKYNLPFTKGVLINEFELNPAGDDKDNEWVEIINATRSRVDLEGYTIHAGSNLTGKVYKITNTQLMPGQREVFYLPGQFLNNANEYIVLKSPDGKIVDTTPTKSDSSNDGRTWQRAADAAMDWAFAEGTPGAGNCGGLLGGQMMKAQVIKLLKDSAVKTMGKMKMLKSTDDLGKFIQVALRDAIDTGIEMLANCLVEAAFFLSIVITDETSSACAGVKIRLFIDSKFIEQGLKYLVGEIESFLFNVENPYGYKPLTILTDNLYLGVTFFWGMNTPCFLKRLDQYPQVQMGIDITCNVSGLCRLVGKNIGEWQVTAGVVIMDCPPFLIPSSQKPDKSRDADLWLMKATFTHV